MWLNYVLFTVFGGQWSAQEKKPYKASATKGILVRRIGRSLLVLVLLFNIENHWVTFSMKPESIMQYGHTCNA